MFYFSWRKSSVLGKMSNTNNYQGGKAFGVLMKQREKDLDEINQQFLSSGTYDKVSISIIHKPLLLHKTQSQY